MSKYIDANAIEKWMKRDEWGTPDERWRPESEFGRMIDAIPAADVEEVRHGEWEEVTTNFIDDLAFDTVASMRCPKCERYHNEVYHYGNPTEKAHYCPFCGTKMDGKEKTDGET